MTFSSYDELKEHCNAVLISTDNRRCSLAHKLAAVPIHRDAGHRDAQADLKPKH